MLDGLEVMAITSAARVADSRGISRDSAARRPLIAAEGIWVGYEVGRVYLRTRRRGLNLVLLLFFYRLKEPYVATLGRC